MNATEWSWEQNRDELKLELAEEVLCSSGELRFVARGASMIPTIFPGDTLIVRHESMDDAHCGDIVLWARDGKFCAHRVVRIETSRRSDEASSLMTRGDALETDDPAIHSDEFLGRVRAIVRRGKYVELASNQDRTMRALAFVVRRSDFMARWLLRYNSVISWLSGNRACFPADQWRESMESE